MSENRDGTFLKRDGKGLKTIVNFIYEVVTGKRHVRILLMPVFASFFLFLVFLAIFLALKADAFFSLSPPLSHPWSYIISLPLLACGAGLWIWSVLQFIKAKGTPIPVNPPPRLIDTGPYAYVRNPMLSGVFLMLFAGAFLAGSSSLLFVFTPAFIGFSILEFKLVEEPELEKRLGESYREYKSRTPILVPKFFRK